MITKIINVAGIFGLNLLFGIYENFALEPARNCLLYTSDAADE